MTLTYVTSVVKILNNILCVHMHTALHILSFCWSYIAFLICIEFVYLYFPVLICLSVSVK